MINTLPELILSKVCEYYNVDVRKVKSNSRKANLVKARQMYSYMTYLITKISLEKIGELINRDHSSITHSISKIRGFLDTYPNIYIEIKEIKNDIENNNCPLLVRSVDLLNQAEMNTKFLNSWVIQ